MKSKRDYRNDLPSLKKQNSNLLKERETLRDEVRILTTERDARCAKLTELWGTLTDIKRLVEMVREVIPVSETGEDWDGLVNAVESFCNDYVRLDVSERRLNDRICDIRRELAAEKSRSILSRIWNAVRRVRG
jgi:predicted nuclease with TOPRIM domain